MKTVGAIKHKLNQVRFRHLKRRLEAELRQTPSNCRFNAEVPSHPSLDGSGVTVEHPSLCMYGAGEGAWTLSYCDARVDNGLRAKQCPMFCSRRTKDEVKEEFTTQLDQMTLPEVAFHYPDMAALLWVLDPEDVSEPVEPEVPIAPAVTAAIPATIVEVEVPPRPPWYLRFLGG